MHCGILNLNSGACLQLLLSILLDQVCNRLHYTAYTTTLQPTFYSICATAECAYSLQLSCHITERALSNMHFTTVEPLFQPHVLELLCLHCRTGLLSLLRRPYRAHLLHTLSLHLRLPFLSVLNLSFRLQPLSLHFEHAWTHVLYYMCMYCHYRLCALRAVMPTASEPELYTVCHKY